MGVRDTNGVWHEDWPDPNDAGGSVVTGDPRAGGTVVGGTGGGGGIGQGDPYGEAAAHQSDQWRAELAERQRQFDQQMAEQRAQWERDGLPRLEIARREIALREQEVAWQRQYQTAQLGLQSANLGLGYLTQASQLRGPSNYFQLANFLRGAQGNPDLPAFLQALQSSVRPGGLTGQQGTSAPTPETMDTLAARLTGTATTPTTAGTGTGTDPSLSAFQALLRRGAGTLAPGSLEALTPTEMGLLNSGIEASGGSMPDFLRQYQMSGIGQ